MSELLKAELARFDHQVKFAEDQPPGEEMLAIRIYGEPPDGVVALIRRHCGAEPASARVDAENAWMPPGKTRGGFVTYDPETSRTIAEHLGIELKSPRSGAFNAEV